MRLACWIHTFKKESLQAEIEDQPGKMAGAGLAVGTILESEAPAPLLKISQIRAAVRLTADHSSALLK